MEVETWKVQLRKGILDMIVLNLLTPKPLYGLEIVQKLEANDELTISEGTIYPILSRLRAEGLVFTEWVESEQGRQRKYYSLSENGRQMLIKLNEAWRSFVDNVEKTINEIGGVR